VIRIRGLNGGKKVYYVQPLNVTVIEIEPHNDTQHGQGWLATIFFVAGGPLRLFDTSYDTLTTRIGVESGRGNPRD
jgi:hypothetical protein